ncbi:MAG: ROK family protein [Planctomycetota bacterium]|jgi:glucokinase
MREIFVGIDLGGTNVKIGCFDSDLKLVTKTSIPTQLESGPESIVDRTVQAAEKILVEAGLSAENICAAGIGSPGPVDVDAGVVIATSNLRFTNVPLRQILSDRLGKPAVLENDANVTCWAEHVAGAGKGANDMVLITLGTGVGGGVISNGELVHGLGSNAGEMGHIIIYPDGRLCGCGQKGCVEAYASASSTATRATEAIKGGAQSSLKKLLDEKGEITCKEVYEHVASGDRLAKEITDDTAKALAIVCIVLLHTTGPERVVFFGGMIGAGELLLKPIRKFFDQYIWTINKEKMGLCFATLGDDAGIIGTASLAIHAREQGRLG